MRFTASTTLLLVSSFGFSSAAWARDFRVNDVPNGAQFTCFNCHMDTNGQTFTPFGSDARCHLVGNVPTEQQHVDWLNPSANGNCGPLYLRDSDGDGATNGAELGDPNGTWTPGQPNPPGTHSNPGDKTSTPSAVCNDGKLGKNEECDGTLFTTTDCLDINMGIGMLKCLPSCHYDTSACSLNASGSGGSGADPASSGCALSSPGESVPSGTWIMGVLGGAALLNAGRRARARRS